MTTGAAVLLAFIALLVFVTLPLDWNKRRRIRAADRNHMQRSIEKELDRQRKAGL